MLQCLGPGRGVTRQAAQRLADCAYRPAASQTCAVHGPCTPGSRHAAKIMAGIAAALAVLFITFPYYIGYLL